MSDPGTTDTWTKTFDGYGLYNFTVIKRAASYTINSAPRDIRVKSGTVPNCSGGIVQGQTIELTQPVK